MLCTFSFPYIATTIFVIKIHLNLADKWKDKGDNYASSTYKNVEPGRQPLLNMSRLLSVLIIAFMYRVCNRRVPIFAT